jgi:hypothetical protein
MFLFTMAIWLRVPVRPAFLRRALGLIALTGDYGVARAAYEEAIRRRPGRIITLRQKTRILADSRRKT